MSYVGMDNIGAGTGAIEGVIEVKSVKSSTFYFTDEHVLYGRLRPYLNKVLVPEFKGHCSTEVFPLKVNENLDRRFLAYWLMSEENVVRFDATSTGARMPRANVKEILGFSFPLPPLEEQRRLVSLLDEALAALDQASENIEANLENVQSLHEAVRTQVLRQQSKSGVNVKLDDVCVVERGSSPRPIKQYRTDDDTGVHWIKIGDTEVGSKYVTHTKERITRIGAEKSRKVEIGDLILTNSMTYGRPYIMKIEGYIHDGWFVLRLNENIDSNFFYHLLSSSIVQEQFKNLAAGAVVKNISGDLVKKAEFRIPSLAKQIEIAKVLDQNQERLRTLKHEYQRKRAEIDELRQSLLQRAFAGELTQTAPLLAVNDNERDERLSTATLVLTFDKHLVEQRQKTFGHVKAQKTLHLTESIGGLDLGRQPQVRQAGPHDQEHFARVEAWAKKNGVFEFKQRRSGGYTFTRGTNYDAFLSEAKTLLADYEAGLSRFLPLMVDMNTQEAEVFTTVHAAWNNLLADGKIPSDDDIVTAARENWHESKMEIARQNFFDAITKTRRHNLEPDGTAKYVRGAQESLI